MGAAHSLTDHQAPPWSDLGRGAKKNEIAIALCLRVWDNKIVITISAREPPTMGFRMFDKTIKAAAACGIVGVELATLRNWRNRYGLEVGTDDGHPKFTLRDLVAISLHKSMIAVSIPTEVSAKFAVQAADQIAECRDKMVEEADTPTNMLIISPRFFKCYFDKFIDEHTPASEKPDWYWQISNDPYMFNNIEEYHVIVISFIIRRIVNAWRDEVRVA